MATTKDITMKQFNGTDYDTLYPKTDVKQVENLTPSSIGAVAKTGDTMTGNLNIASNNGTTSLIQYSGNTTIRNAKGSQNYTDIEITGDDLLVFNTMISGHYNRYNILHTGNAQSLGFPKIATGSYVGTGYSGQSHPMSINVGFAPKLFWICLKLDNRDGEPVAVMIPGGSASDSNGLFIYPFTKYFCGDSTRDYYVTVTWGSTMSWYGLVDFNDTTHGKYQFNEAGVTYYWVAIG